MRFILPSLLALLPMAAHAGEIERVKADGSNQLAKAARIPIDSELFYVSGQIASPVDPSRPLAASLTREEMGDTRLQTISALGKAKAILEAHGYAMSDVIKATVFLVGDPALGGGWDFAGMNEGFKQYFGTADNPNVTTRSTVQVVGVAYPNCFVEIELIAAKAPAGRKKR